MLNLVICAALLASPAAWDSLRFLEGDWTGQGSGHPGDTSGGGFTFHQELGGNVMVRKNRAEYPATKDRAAFVHEDLMVVYPGGPDKPAQADYWDSEGHVIHYTVTSDGKAAVFLSDTDRPGPRYRLTYAGTGAKSISIKFEVAPPGQSFQTYIEATAQRK